MQQRLGKRRIDEMVEYLHSRLPNPPTAVNGCYDLPKGLYDAAATSHTSGKPLQDISDHIGYFLGILRSVPVQIVQEGADSRWIGTSSGRIVSGVFDSPVSGEFMVTGSDYREIVILKKTRFRLEHILAILAHESTHNYLHQYGVRRADETENEILTDIGAAYLGLGGLLLSGYKPIYWTSDHWNWLVARGHTTHTLSLGYVEPKAIRYAIARSAELRRLEQLSAVLPLILRMRVTFHLRKLMREKGKRDQRLDTIMERVQEVRMVCNRASDMLHNAPKGVRCASLSPEEGRKIVEIANALAVGEVELALDRVWQSLKRAKQDGEVDDAALGSLEVQADELLERIKGWDHVVRKVSMLIRESPHGQ